MLHIIWYVIVGLIAGVVAKSAMHTHMSFLLTIALGIVGSVVGGLITHLIFRPKRVLRFTPPGSSYPSLARSWYYLFGTTSNSTCLPPNSFREAQRSENPLVA
ncbi:MAG: GlsB/YeaQ/YmgE family stress response membrane protein [Acidobacteriota bacterium]|nr:GlsB/YeaQ/YmgE family stress response membrane protein [Acidobacteriota bacterium]